MRLFVVLLQNQWSKWVRNYNYYLNISLVATHVENRDILFFSVQIHLSVMKLLITYSRIREGHLVDWTLFRSIFNEEGTTVCPAIIITVALAILRKLRILTTSAPKFHSMSFRDSKLYKNLFVMQSTHLI